MKRKLVLVMLAAAGASLAQAPKVALVNMETAMTSTIDGQNAEKRLDDQFSQRKLIIDRKQKEVADLQARLDKGDLSAEERQKLAAEIDVKTDGVDKETTQADADLTKAQRGVLRELGPKLVAAIAKYAKEHGFDVVFDISNTDLPRLYSDSAVDITKEVVEEYERMNPQPKGSTAPPKGKK